VTTTRAKLASGARRPCLIGLALTVYAPTALAYVDPGLLGTLYQAAYVLLFGALTALVFRPWHYVRGLFRQRTDRRPPEADAQARPRGKESTDR
jgi:hypothetical protein